MALPYYNDYQMRFDYDPQNNKFAFIRKAIGPTAYTDVDEHETETPSDDNGIWVSAAGNDSDAGTEAAPKLTLLAAMNACNATKIYVWIDDSSSYLEDLSGSTNEYFSGFYATSGNTPSYLSLDATYISDFQTIYAADEFIYVSDDTGDDVAGDGSYGDPYATIAKAVSEVAVGKEKVCIIDSATYTEPGIEFTGNFQQLWAWPGETPTFNTELSASLINTAASEIVAATIFEAGVTNYISCSIMSSDNFVIAYRDEGDANKGKFVIYNSSGVEQVAATVFEAGSTYDISCAIMSDDNFVIAYSDNGDGNKGKFVIIDADGSSILYGPTEFEAGSTDQISCSVMSDDNFVIAYCDRGDGDKGKFVIYNSSGVEQVAATVFESGATYDISCAIMSDDNFVVAYFDNGDGNKGKFVIYNSAGVEQVAPTEFEAGSTDDISCAIMSNDNFVIAYSDNGDGNKGKFVIYNSSGVEQVAATEFKAGNPGVSTYISCAIMSNDNFVIAYSDNGDGNKGKFVIYNSAGVEQVAPTEFEAGTTYVVSCSVMSGDSFVIAYRDNGDGDKGKFVIYYPPKYDMILASTDASINGIAFTQDYENFIDNMIHGDSSEVEVRFCALDNCVNGSGRDAWCIYGDDVTTVQSCLFSDNDQGVYVAANEATIEENIFYRNNEGYAIHIDGTAAVSGDITVEHNTIFSNYGGIRLENNDGINEVIKNNILHENSVYGINAETAMTYSYSVCTDTNNNATAGASVINANPLFINEGELVADDIDLRIKLRVLDYPADSPAYQLADDSSPDRDAGAWDVVTIGEAYSWSTFTMQKPIDGIDIEISPVGATRLVKKDGTIATGYESWMEEVSFRFRGILDADFDNIMAMMTCGNNEIRWYPDPTTNASDYNAYTLIYDGISASAGHYKLTETGVQDLRFKMARAYS